MSDSPRRIACKTHGTTEATFVCGHLARGVALGHFCASDGGRWPDAWCSGCQARFVAAGGDWVGPAQEQLQAKALCTGCYELARDRNQRLPPELLGKSAPLAAAEAKSLVHAMVHRSQQRQDEAARRGFDIVAAAHWDYDADANLLRFTRPDGSAFFADLLTIGSWSTRTDSWLWSWGNESVEPKACGEVRLLRAFGEVWGLEKLAQPHWQADELDGWEMASIALCVLGGDGLYRVPFEHVRSFFLLQNLRNAPSLH